MQASKRFIECLSFVREKADEQDHNEYMLCVKSVSSNKTPSSKQKMHILLGQSLTSNENKYHEWYTQTHIDKHLLLSVSQKKNEQKEAKHDWHNKHFFPVPHKSTICIATTSWNIET